MCLSIKILLSQKKREHVFPLHCGSRSYLHLCRKITSPASILPHPSPLSPWKLSSILNFLLKDQSLCIFYVASHWVKPILGTGRQIKFQKHFQIQCSEKICTQDNICTHQGWEEKTLWSLVRNPWKVIIFASQMDPGGVNKYVFLLHLSFPHQSK